MTLSDWANIGQVVAALAVVASLLFVGLQVRQNTKSNQSYSIAAQRRPTWLNYITTIADPNSNKVYAMGAPPGKLDQQQFVQFYMLCRATFMGCEKPASPISSGVSG